MVKLQKIYNLIHDLKENLEDEYIKVIPLKKNKKLPRDKNWTLNNYSVDDLEGYDGNFGIIPGFNHELRGYSLAIVDIDGYTFNSDVESEKLKYKKLTSEYLFNCLKDIPGALLVETQSGGKHIYLWNKTVSPLFHETSKHLHFPADFPVEELRGESLKHSIEIFTKEGSKQCLLPGDVVFNKDENKLKEYKVISKVNRLNDIAIVDNINKTIKNKLIEKGFQWVETSDKHITDNTYSNNEPKDTLKTLSEEEIEKLSEIVSKLLKTVDGSKHTASLFLGGYFSRTITEDSAYKVCRRVIHEVGGLLEDPNAFIKTVIQNYSRNVEHKAGLPHLSEVISDYKSDFNKKGFMFQLNRICKQNYNHKILLSHDGENHKKFLSINYDEYEISSFRLNKKQTENGEEKVWYDQQQTILNMVPLKIYESYNILDHNASPELCLTYYRKGMPFKQTLRGDNILNIEKQLEQRPGVVLKPRLYKGILNEIIKEYQSMDMVHIVEDIPVEGIFINPINNKLSRANKKGSIPITKPSKKAVIEGLKVWDKLGKFYPGDNRKLSHIIRWGLISPFSYIFKTIGEWIPYLYLYGASRTAKTTLAEICLSPYTEIDDDISIGGNSVDTPYRMGKALSRQGIGTIVNEPGSVIEKGEMVELIKRAIESEYCREKMQDGVHVKIPAYSNLLFTSNSFLPTNDALIRRGDIIEFIKSERMSKKGITEFKKVFHYVNKENSDFTRLRGIGDFIVWYVSENMDTLKLNMEEWKDSMLDALFEYTGYKPIKWLYTDCELMDMSSTDNEILNTFRRMVLRDYRRLTAHNHRVENEDHSIKVDFDENGEAVIENDSTEKKMGNNLKSCIAAGYFDYLNLLVNRQNECIVLVNASVKDDLYEYAELQVTCKGLADYMNKEYKNYKYKGKAVKCFGVKLEEFVEFLYRI